MVSREELIEIAAGVNEGYRIGDDKTLEIGFLFGTAELITSLTLKDGESYHDVRLDIAKAIDNKAKLKTYSILSKEVQCALDQR